MAGFLIGNRKIVETDKALGIKMENKQVLWLPKSQISNLTTWEHDEEIQIPEWLYDKKVEEYVE